jgi:hypothetical protein
MKALALSLLATLAIAAPAAAVDNGVPDGNRHPNVGLLGFELESQPYFQCTGMVISHRAFLTAAHCIDVFAEDEVVTLAPGSPNDPAYQPGVLFEGFPYAIRTPVHRPLATVVHPRFDPETLAHDVAVLVFRPRTFRVRPVTLPPPRLLDLLRIPQIARHVDFTLVGYGADPDYSGPEPRYVVPGFRQTATAPFGALTARQLLLDRSRGGLCLGDSGSPQFLGRTNIAVALFSSPGETCQEMVSQRLDTRAEQRFLAPYVQAGSAKTRHESLR